MKYYSIRDFRSDTKKVCEDVQEYGEAIVTNNGKPTLLLIDISNDDAEEFLTTLRQVKAMKAFNRIRARAAEMGYMTDEEIDAEIKAYRKERREKRESLKNGDKE